MTRSLIGLISGRLCFTGSVLTLNHHTFIVYMLICLQSSSFLPLPAQCCISWYIVGQWNRVKWLVGMCFALQVVLTNNPQNGYLLVKRSKTPQDAFKLPRWWTLNMVLKFTDVRVRVLKFNFLSYKSLPFGGADCFNLHRISSKIVQWCKLDFTNHSEELTLYNTTVLPSFMDGSMIYKGVDPAGRIKCIWYLCL